MRYSDGSGISANANAKAFVWSVKFTPKIRTESGKLSSIGCHFPPKLTNFGTLLLKNNLALSQNLHQKHVYFLNTRSFTVNHDRSLVNLRVCGAANLQEEQKIIYYYPATADVNDRIKDVGLVEALVQFARSVLAPAFLFLQWAASDFWICCTAAFPALFIFSYSFIYFCVLLWYVVFWTDHMEIFHWDITMLSYFRSAYCLSRCLSSPWMLAMTRLPQYWGTGKNSSAAPSQFLVVYTALTMCSTFSDCRTFNSDAPVLSMQTLKQKHFFLEPEKNFFMSLVSIASDNISSRLCFAIHLVSVSVCPTTYPFGVLWLMRTELVSSIWFWRAGLLSTSSVPEAGWARFNRLVSRHVCPVGRCGYPASVDHVP